MFTLFLQKKVYFDEDDTSYDYHEKDIVNIIDTVMGDMKERMSAINAHASSMLDSSENMIRSHNQIATLLAANVGSEAAIRARDRITEGLASAQALFQNYKPNFDNIEQHFTNLSDLTAKICSPVAHKESNL